MGSITLFMVTSVDCYFEGPNHDISWHMVDDEFNDFAIEQTKSFEALVFGHKTYSLMEQYWPHAAEQPGITPEDLVIAQIMTNLPKYAVAHQIFTPNWQNVTVLTSDVEQQIKRIRGEASRPIAVFGSNNLCVSLIQMGLLDEIRLMICPVAIGQGNSLFAGLSQKIELKCTDTRQFQNGNVLLTYQVVRD
jgi:dihydrofolate reductase